MLKSIKTPIRYAITVISVFYFSISNLYAAVGITTPSLNISTCTFPSNYITLGNIVINENANGDFGLAAVSTNYSLILTIPTNFEFSPGVGSVAVSATGDITAISIVVTATTVTITYQSNEGNRVNEDDIVTISGLQVRAITTASSGNIFRTVGNPGTGVIAGITNGTTNFGTMTSVVACPMSITSATVTQCAGVSAAKCAENVQIVRLEITTTGILSPITLTQIQTNFAGTAGVGALSNVDIYYTGTSNTFSSVSLFGSNASPSTSTYNINGSQNLATGVNYFWLVYDLNNTGTIANTIDGLITQFTASSVNYNSGSTPNISTTNPAGTIALTLCVTPGGVMNGLETWLKANSGITGTTPITVWANQNSGGTAVLVNGAPNLNTASNSYNYNPYIDFTAPVGALGDGAAANREFLKLSGYNGPIGIDYKALFFTQNLTDLSRTYTHLATTDYITISGPLNGTLHGSADGTSTIAAFHLDAYDADLAPNGSWQKNGTDVISNFNHSTNKNIISANSTTGGGTTLNRFLGGQNDDASSTFHGDTRDWKGPVAEIIGFTNALTATEKQKINSYLAVKYGVTLTTNYLSTSGGTIFTTVSPYNLNIIGIGRDDDEALTQKQSHNDDDTVRIYLNTLAASNAANAGSFSNNISYIMTGANSGKLCATLASLGEKPAACGLYSRLEREWKVTKTNITENFNMDIKLGACGAPASVSVADLRFLVDDDGNFGNGGTTCYYNGDGTGIVISYVNPTIKISNIATTHIPNNSTRFVTIGSINAGTPLPIELLSFTGNCEKGDVNIQWQTASELNNDYFIIESSEDGITWNGIANINGAGNSYNTLNYQFVDENPLSGIHYYRLKQVDYDGTYTYSEIISTNCSESNTLINIYPNPFNEFITVDISGYKNKSATISIVDLLGQETLLLEPMLLGSERFTFHLSEENYSAAIYFVKIVIGGEVFVKKIVR